MCELLLKTFRLLDDYQNLGMYPEDAQAAMLFALLPVTFHSHELALRCGRAGAAHGSLETLFELLTTDVPLVVSCCTKVSFFKRIHCRC